MGAAKKKIESELKVEEKLWGIPEVADYLGVGRTSVYQLISTDNLPSLVIAGKRRFIPEQIKGWAKKKTV